MFGKYQVIRRLAVGGMGEIFLARQTGVAGFDRLAILKSLLPELAEQEGFVDQFLDEARVAATLNHPNIVSIYEVGQWGGLYFIAMEYIRGENLGRLLQAASVGSIPVPLPVPVRIVQDSALALDHAHHASDTEGKPLSIVHRDIGLQNIMVRDDGVAKVVDFGIARAANRSTRTRTGLVKGKLQYMSPEQIAGKELDGRADQFSLGIVLWEMATQQRLFKAENEFLSIQKIVHQPIPKPSELVPDFPGDLEAVIMRMLQRDPARRFARCADVADELAHILDRLSVTAADSQKAVAAFVQRALGEKLAEATRDLTPSTETPFASMIGLTGLQGDLGVTRAIGTGETTSRGRRRLLTALGLGVAVVLAALGAGVATGVLPGLQRTPTAPRLEILEPAGARVIINGEIQAQSTPTVVTGLAPGLHRVQLELPDLPPIRRQVLLEPNKTVSIREAPPAKGMVLDVREPPGAKVIVDGVAWPEPVPTVVTGLQDGPHEVRLELPDGRIVKRRLRLEIGRPILLQDAPPATGMVIDLRDPEGAEVLVDGTPWPERVPTVISGLSMGKHQLEFRLPGLPVLQRTVALESGQPVLLSEPPPAAGTVIDIREPSGAKVLVNRKPWPEVVPTVVTGLAPGTHEVRLELAGRPAIVKKVELVADQPLLIQEQPPLARPTLVLKSRPSGATVTLGGRRLGKTPVRILTLEPEVEHSLLVERRGYAPESLALTLAPGEKREELVQLESSRGGGTPSPAPTPQPVAAGPVESGFLTLNTNPWVKVAINGRPYGSTPLYKVELPPGSYTLHLVNEEFGINAKRTVQISAGKTNKVDWALK